MIVVDANILIYAYHADAPLHKAAARWLEDVLDGAEIIGLPWITLWAFLRISTNPRLWPNPKSAEDAFQVMQDLLAQPRVVIVGPEARHPELLQRLVVEHRASGPLLTDAVLAALALEHGATLASADQDFSRFTDLRWVNPLR